MTAAMWCGRPHVASGAGRWFAEVIAMRIRSLLLAALLVGSLRSPGAAGTLSVKLTTSPAPNNGQYAPRNIVAVWIEDSAGAFVKTIGRYAATRRGSLVAWTTAAGPGDADAVSGATRQNHVAPLTVTWDMKNRAGAEVPDGTYKIRMEVADRNSNAAAQNNQGTFTFAKNAAGSTQTTAGGGFTDVVITYSVVAPVCSNGTVDAGETCDPPGSCPTSCAVAADACAPSVLTGSAAACTAACVVQTISECIAGDGCCPGSCTAASDNDCSDLAGSDDNSGLSGGCDIGGDSSGWLLLLGGLAVVGSRRRRRA
jgi:MYXO-CTERM domain-containing protein